MLPTSLEMINIKDCYEKVASDFCQNYYRIWDNDFNMICKLYISSPMITYLDMKFNKVYYLINYIKNSQGICKFDHINFKGTGQPLDENSILIQITGTITVNNSIHWRKYTETLIIKRNIWNTWHISNSIFSLID